LDEVVILVITAVTTAVVPVVAVSFTAAPIVFAAAVVPTGIGIVAATAAAASAPAVVFGWLVWSPTVIVLATVAGIPLRVPADTIEDARLRLIWRLVSGLL
jgi:hypothetical protein